MVRPRCGALQLLVNSDLPKLAASRWGQRRKYIPTEKSHTRVVFRFRFVFLIPRPIYQASKRIDSAFSRFLFYLPPWIQLSDLGPLLVVVLKQALLSPPRYGTGLYFDASLISNFGYSHLRYSASSTRPRKQPATEEA